jgi:hypothetical protein
MYETSWPDHQWKLTFTYDEDEVRYVVPVFVCAASEKDALLVGRITAVSRLRALS